MFQQLKKRRIGLICCYQTTNKPEEMLCRGNINIVGLKGREQIADALTHLLISAANKLIEQEFEAELEGLLAVPSGRRTDGDYNALAAA